ncbi:MAG: acyl-CoA thioesterase [Candidatus Anammoximicrobium sp.]|nr:acyl-CoA thioesterase [Candidatus Anammoximicrobium sp.]
MPPTADRPNELAGYLALVTLPVQWGDQDAFGHVNNAVPLRWFESSRIVLLEEHDLSHLMGEGELVPLVASITCNYRRQITYPDAVCIGTRVAELRHSRMTLSHAVYSRQQRQIVADGQTVVVFYNRAKQRPTRVPVELRERLAPAGVTAPAGSSSPTPDQG